MHSDLLRYVKGPGARGYSHNPRKTIGYIMIQVKNSSMPIF
jgi:hypothetical protein